MQNKNFLNFNMSTPYLGAMPQSPYLNKINLPMNLNQMQFYNYQKPPYKKNHLSRRRRKRNQKNFYNHHNNRNSNSNQKNRRFHQKGRIRKSGRACEGNLTQNQIFDIRDELMKEDDVQVISEKLGRAQQKHFREKEKVLQKMLSKMKTDVEWRKPKRVDRLEGECQLYGENSKELNLHKIRINEKISCYYRKEYQIPDQPQIKPVNCETMTEKKIMIIKLPEDAFDSFKPDGNKSTGGETDDLSIDLSKESNVDQDEEEFDDEEDVLIQNKLQLFKDPEHGILKDKVNLETVVEKKRWNGIKMMRNFFGQGDEDNQNELGKIHKENNQQLLLLIQNKTFTYDKNLIQNNLKLMKNLIDNLQKGKKVIIPNLDYGVRWDSPKDMEELEIESIFSQKAKSSHSSPNFKNQSNLKRKTMPCKYFHSNLGIICGRGDDCDFIHDHNFKGKLPPVHTYIHLRQAALKKELQLSGRRSGARSVKNEKIKIEKKMVGSAEKKNKDQTAVDDKTSVSVVKKLDFGDEGIKKTEIEEENKKEINNENEESKTIIDLKQPTAPIKTPNFFEKPKNAESDQVIDHLEVYNSTIQSLKQKEALRKNINSNSSKQENSQGPNFKPYPPTFTNYHNFQTAWNSQNQKNPEENQENAPNPQTKPPSITTVTEQLENTQTEKSEKKSIEKEKNKNEKQEGENRYQNNKNNKNNNVAYYKDDYFEDNYYNNEEYYDDDYYEDYYDDDFYNEDYEYGGNYRRGRNNYRRNDGYRGGYRNDRQFYQDSRKREFRNDERRDRRDYERDEHRKEFGKGNGDWRQALTQIEPGQMEKMIEFAKNNPFMKNVDPKFFTRFAKNFQEFQKVIKTDSERGFEDEEKKVIKENSENVAEEEKKKMQEEKPENETQEEGKLKSPQTEKNSGKKSNLVDSAVQTSPMKIEDLEYEIERRRNSQDRYYRGRRGYRHNNNQRYYQNNDYEYYNNNRDYYPNRRRNRRNNNNFRRDNYYDKRDKKNHYHYSNDNYDQYSGRGYNYVSYERYNKQKIRRDRQLRSERNYRDKRMHEEREDFLKKDQRENQENFEKREEDEKKMEIEEVKKIEKSETENKQSDEGKKITEVKEDKKFKSNPQDEKSEKKTSEEEKTSNQNQKNLKKKKEGNMQKEMLHKFREMVKTFTPDFIQNKLPQMLNMQMYSSMNFPNQEKKKKNYSTIEKNMQNMMMMWGQNMMKNIKKPKNNQQAVEEAKTKEEKEIPSVDINKMLNEDNSVETVKASSNKRTAYPKNELNESEMLPERDNSEKKSEPVLDKEDKKPK